MKAIIMAGGHGTRLRPITLTRPKPLVPVAGEACIDFVLKALKEAGVEDIIITTGYRAGELIAHTGGGSRYGDFNIVYSIEDEPLGTAGGVKKMERFLHDTFIVASGDVLADVDFGQLIRFHEERGADATMALTTVDEPTQFGIVGVDDEGRIQRFKEKPAPDEVFSNLINAGIYILEPSVLDLMPENTKFDFSKQLFPKMLESGMKLYATPLSGYWKDIGSPFDLIDANQEMIRRKDGHRAGGSREEFPGVGIKEPFFGGKGVMIERGSNIEASALFPGTIIGRESELTDTVVFHEGKVGKECRIIHSIIGAGSMIGDKCSLEDCVIGDDQKIPNGSSLKGMKIPESEGGNTLE